MTEREYINARPSPALCLSVALSNADVLALTEWHAAIVAAEREQCAKIAEEWGDLSVADAIRAAR